MLRALRGVKQKLQGPKTSERVMGETQRKPLSETPILPYTHIHLSSYVTKADFEAAMAMKKKIKIELLIER